MNEWIKTEKNTHKHKIICCTQPWVKYAWEASTCYSEMCERTFYIIFYYDLVGFCNDLTQLKNDLNVTHWQPN